MLLQSRIVGAKLGSARLGCGHGGGCSVRGLCNAGFHGGEVCDPRPPPARIPLPAQNGLSAQGAFPGIETEERIDSPLQKALPHQAAQFSPAFLTAHFSLPWRPAAKLRTPPFTVRPFRKQPLPSAHRGYRGTVLEIAFLTCKALPAKSADPGPISYCIESTRIGKENLRRRVLTKVTPGCGRGRCASARRCPHLQTAGRPRSRASPCRARSATALARVGEAFSDSGRSRRMPRWAA